MIALRISEILAGQCPDFAVGLLQCATTNTDHDEGLWSLIDQQIADVLDGAAIEDVNQHPEIAATRAGYKRCGKDPNRYRPSAEALRRRLFKGQVLYRVSTLVDIVNLLSLRTGCSIGAFDVQRISGGLEWGIGEEGEPYEAIGRGSLNIAGLPVVRDEAGPIGTPTSDHMRTRLTLETSTLLLNVNSFQGRQTLPEVLDEATELVSRFGGATGIETAVVPSS